MSFCRWSELSDTASYGEFVMSKSGRFRFHGGAATFVGTALPEP